MSPPGDQPSRGRGGGVKSPQPKRRRPVCQYRIRGRGIVENFFGTGFWPHVFPLYINCLPTVPAKSPRRSVEGHTRPALRQSAALFRSTAPMPGKVRDRGSRADRCAPLAGTVRGPLPELDPGRAPRGRVARPCACASRSRSRAAVRHPRGVRRAARCAGRCQRRPCRCPPRCQCRAAPRLSRPRP